MSVKSTEHLSRQEAEDLFVRTWCELREQKARAKAVKLSDAELGDKLDEMVDEAAGGESFRNFIVSS